MSIECNNTTPLGSRAGEELLNSTSDALTSAIVDLASLVPSDDPINNVDRVTAIDVTNTLNKLLEDENLDEFPSVKDKFNSDEGITVTDIAQFAIDNNTNLTELLEDLTKIAPDGVELVSDTQSGIRTGVGTGGIAGGSGTGTGTGGVGSSGISDGTGTGTGSGVGSGTGAGGTGTGGTGTGTGTGSGGLTGNLSGVSGGGTAVSSTGNLGTQGPVGSGATNSTLNTGSGASTILDNDGLGNTRLSTTSTGGTGTGGTGSAIDGTGTGTGGAVDGTGSVPTTFDANYTGNNGSSTNPLTENTVGSTPSTPIDTSFRNSGATSSSTASRFAPSVINTNFTNNLSKGKDSDGFFSRNQALGIITGDLDPKQVILSNVLKDLDFNFAQNIGANLTGSLCGVYNDVLADLTKAFAVVNTGKKFINNIQNVIEKDVKKLAESIKQKGILATLMDLLRQVIEGAIAAAKGVAMAAVGSAVVLLKGMGAAAKAIMKKLNRVMKNINDYMEDASVQKIIKDMELLVVKLAESFERLTPQNVANILFRLCQMAQDLQAKLMEPALRLNRMANSISRETRAVKSQSAYNTQQAVKYGAIRVSENERQAKKTRGIGKYQKAAPSNREADYVANTEPTDSEISMINAVSESGLGNITFSSAVINEGDGAGWKEIDDSVYAKLLRVANQTGNSYEVKQGYKVRTKGKDRVGAIAMNSHHSGYAVDIVVNEGNRDDTIVAASRAGFTGIGVYTGHLHLDLAARRGWQSGYSGETQASVQALLDKHTIDGFKKKRS